MLFVDEATPDIPTLAAFSVIILALIMLCSASETGTYPYEVLIPKKKVFKRKRKKIKDLGLKMRKVKK